MRPAARLYVDRGDRVDAALWLLLWFRLKGWLRRLVRNANTVRGLLLLIVGLFFFSCIFVNPILTYFFGFNRMEGAGGPEHVRRVGSLGLFAYCALTLLFSSGERAISFSPAEVNFLFSGPFTRRQLLAYKIMTSVLACLVTAVFMMTFLLSYGAWPLAAYLGLVLTLLFLSLFGMVVGLVLTTLGARAHSRRRQVVLGVLLVLVLLALLPLGRELGRLTPPEILQRVEQSRIVQAVLTPLNWFVLAFTAQDAGSLLNYLLRAAGVDGFMLLLVFVLDVQYLEASVAASERVHARLQRLRRAGASAAWSPAQGTPRFSLPSLPWWGGVGPIAWRQLTTALRSLRGLAIFLSILGAALLVVPLAVFATGEHGQQTELGKVLASALLGLSFVSLPGMLTFDFRGDVDRMDVLKALPIAAWRVAVGQLAAPMVLLSLIQLGALAAIEALSGGVEEWLLVTLILAWPANFLSLGIDNLLFLWFPTRQTVTMPGDFQLMGRQMLLLLAKGVVLGLVAVVAVLLGSIIALLTGHRVAGYLGASVVVASFAAGLVPLLALAFDRFDVARDTPP